MQISSIMRSGESSGSRYTSGPSRMRLVMRATAPRKTPGTGTMLSGVCVMLGEMQAVEAGLVAGLDKTQALVEQLGERALAMLDVIEQSDFHATSADVTSVNFRFRNLPGAGEEVEVAALVGLADVLGEHGAVAARIARGWLLSRRRGGGSTLPR